MSWTDRVSPSIRSRAADVRLVVFDVDGVLTDGTLSYSGSGEEVKHFNVKDGVGIKLLQCFDVTTAVISAKQSGALAKRVSDLRVSHFYPGTSDKWSCLKSLLDELDIRPEQVCYVGDDVIDLTVMTRVGLAIAPSDGFWMVRDRAHYVTDVAGGRGVAREVADLILGSRMSLEDAYIKAMLPEFEVKK